jgi:hypothetical protein
VGRVLSSDSSIKVQEVYRLYVGTKVLRETPQGPPRDFSTNDDALAFGAALLHTGQATEIDVRKVYRLPL